MTNSQNRFLTLIKNNTLINLFMYYFSDTFDDIHVHLSSTHEHHVTQIDPQNPTSDHTANRNQAENHLDRINHLNNSNEESHDHDEMFMEELSTLRSFLLLIALTFHSVFEGLAIGLQQESMSLYELFVAVIVHKAIMAFSLGLNLAQSKGITIKVFIIATLTFSIASPIGLSLGIGLSHLQKNLARDIANGTLQVKYIFISEMCFTYVFLT